VSIDNRSTFTLVPIADRSTTSPISLAIECSASSDAISGPEDYNPGVPIECGHAIDFAASTFHLKSSAESCRMMDAVSVNDSIGPVLGRTPSGVFILTTRNATGRETGMLVSWVQQASFAPPMVTVAVNRKRFLVEWLAESPRLVLNLVGETQKRFLKHFGAGFGPDETAFEGVNVSRTESGLPILADAIGFLEGTVRSQLETGDHVVYAVEITAGGCGPEFSEAKPMVHLRKNGFNY
jgi:flavin reductase (DIM6/NTAB) family NADH-FMN oxidoreductase RutF